MQNDSVEDGEDIHVIRFISDLRQEALHIASEKELLRDLNEKVRNKTDELLQSSWVTTKKRLALLPQREFTLQNIQGIISLGSVQFIEAKDVLGFEVTGKISNLLQFLRTQPEQLAQWLLLGEQFNDEQTQTCIMQSIIAGLYGSLIFPEDINYMLVLLHELAKFQLFRHENPQRALKQRSSSFEYLYSMFHEILLSSKYFLSGALEVPILRLLTIDYYLDIEPEKTAMRFKQEDDMKLLFKSSEEYRTAVEQTLSDVTNSFICSLKDFSFSFPKPLAWITYQISKFIADTFNDKEGNAVLTELIFTMFICPAVVNPLQYGICDAQITTVSRHNLMQIGQIIQNLALIKYEPPDFKVSDLYSLLNKDVIVQFLDEVFSGIQNSTVPPLEVIPFICREFALFTEAEVRILVTFLQRMHRETRENETYNKDAILTDSLLEKISSSLNSMENAMQKESRFFNGTNDNNLKRSSNLMSLVSRTNNKIADDITSVPTTVLIFSIRTELVEPIGMQSEVAVIKDVLSDKEMYASTKPIQKNDDGDDNKINTFNYPDEGSIGNTSDNLEAISEGASNHSVASSLELENEDQNDNYSDMLSANVSGRGTPNISGRDTPSSQINENEERAPSEPRPVDNSQPQRQSQLSRQIRSEIDDKFCKFEIKLPGPGRDETTSLISETWSTDVLASDNETIDANDSRNDPQPCCLMDQPIIEVPTGNILDISETHSESAWSTDVAASDTERLIEIDNDDTGSIAQSDDTNSIAPSDDTRSETDENSTPGSRRFSASSNSFMNQISSASNYQELRRMELEQSSSLKSQDKNSKKDSNANVIFKSLSYSSTQNSSAYSEQTSQKKMVQSSTTSFVSRNVQKSLTRIENKNSPGTNISHKRYSIESDSSELSLSYMKQNRNKYENGPNELLLSNCSLNSSSSGSSGNSMENNKTTNEISDKWENKQWINSSQNSLNVTSTPSESTSELSVLSVTNYVDPANMVSKKSNVLHSRNMKSSNSTGAIPKSISFDISADKGDKYIEEDHRSKRGGFFGKLRMGFRNRRVKSFRAEESKMEKGIERSPGESSSNSHNQIGARSNDLDSTDQILEKYRTRTYEKLGSNKVEEEISKSPRVRHLSESTIVSNHGINSFKDIKNKLRMVLSHSTLQLPGSIEVSDSSVKRNIETVLRTELGKARKLRHWSSVARITETLRCVQLLNEKNCIELVKSMKDDIIKRSIYTQYLTSSRRDLLFREAFLDGLQDQICYEKEQCEEYLAILYVEDYLRHKETEINGFCEDFKLMSLSDEKCDILDTFYSQLYSDMTSNTLWNEIFRERKNTIRMALQTYIISKVYEYALFPNGDGDRDRDRVLHEHIQKLSNLITPEHKYLMIQKIFLRECPWLPAQEALNAMSAFRTPRDKVDCVIHCAKCIMDLLSMAQNRSTTADDFTPVLVYVIIKSNPPNLLSTIQLVNSFYQNQLCGEEQYWWIQFCAAVEFIKTMDYSD